MLFKAMKGKIPKYTHLPLVFGNDKKKLSKRHGETSVLEFKKRGYLPEALITYFSQLSWNPGDTKKVYFLEELSTNFNFSKLSKNSPVFDYDKLLFLNSRAIRNSDPMRILNILFEEKSVKKEFEHVKISRIFDLIELVKPRMKLIYDFIDHFRIYLFGEFKYKQMDIESLSLEKSIVEYFKRLIFKLKKIDNFTSENIEVQLRNTAKELNIEAKILIHPSRLALTGMNVSPSVFDVYSFLGKEESVKRINNFLNHLKKNVFTD
jgi:glutamyl-tRNA synthetase/nondiscriminating glutamyl-tRNA synthetase